MPLDPQTRFVLDQIAAQGGLELDQLSPAEARQAFEKMRVPLPGEPVARSEDRRVPGPAGEVPVRVYTPDGIGDAAPAVVFFHGGGWVIGSLETHDNFCRVLARTAHAPSSSRSTTGSPPSTASRRPREDCYAVTRWVASRAPASASTRRDRRRRRQRGRQPRRRRVADGTRSRRAGAPAPGADLPRRRLRLRAGLLPRERRGLPPHPQRDAVVLGPLRPRARRTAQRLCRAPPRRSPRRSAARHRDHRRVRSRSATRARPTPRACAKPASPRPANATTARSTASSASSKSSTRAAAPPSRSPRRCAKRWPDRESRSRRATDPAPDSILDLRCDLI